MDDAEFKRLQNSYLDAFARALREHGADPEDIVIKNVALKKGNEICVYAIPTLSEYYVSEREARAARRDGQSLYRVAIARVE